MSGSTFSLRKILLRNMHCSTYTADSHTYMTTKVHVSLALEQTQINNMTNTITSCHIIRLI